MKFIARWPGYLFRGLRTGNAPLAGLGAALAALAWLRRTARPKRELLWAKTLKPGDAIRVRLIDEDEIAD